MAACQLFFIGLFQEWLLAIHGPLKGRSAFTYRQNASTPKNMSGTAIRAFASSGRVARRFGGRSVWWLWNEAADFMIHDKNRIFDGFVTLESGVDSGRAPNLIDTNQVASAENMVFGGGGGSPLIGFGPIKNL